MVKKSYINEVVSLKVKNRRTPICGVVLEYNDHWTLMKSNPVDYVIDGYILINNKKVSAFRQDEEELFKQNIVQRKGVLSGTSGLMLSENETALFFTIQHTYGLLQFELKSEKICYIGSIMDVQSEHITVQLVDSYARKIDTMDILINEIVSVQFDNDYTNSLKLVMDTE
ncbi:hypothetical protein [Edaphocola aurantiacus]|uniref:hypothetical protein n=1 Tax=Edaphocola aurantiacus TaxID=2601682 RepID=UPI001C96ADF0|nr:hypothetical protein [Edaphocola aurantiacus]